PCPGTWNSMNHFPLCSGERGKRRSIMQHQDIGDANVERLLQAYKPEPVDTAFARQVEDEMCAAALAASKAEPTCTTWPGLRYSEAPAGESGDSEYLSPG